VTGSNGGEIILWDIASRQPKKTFHITGSLKKLSFSEDGMLLAGATRVFGPTGHTDVWVWNLRSGRIISHAFQAPTVVRFTALAFSPSNKRIVIGASNFMAWSVDLGDGYGNHSISSCYNTMQATFLHSGNGLIINGAYPPGAAGIAQICLATSGSLLRKLSTVRSDAEEGTALRLSRDGESVLTATDHGTLQVFSVRSGARIGPTIRSSVSVTDCDLSPDGSYAAVAGADGSVRTWNLETGDPVGSVLWHRQEVTKVRFDRSGTRLLSCSKDGSARLWSIKATGIEEYATDTTSLINPQIGFWITKNRFIASDMNSIYQWNPDGNWVRVLDGYRLLYPRIWARPQRRVVVYRQNAIRVFDFNSNTFITPSLRCALGVVRERAYASLSQDGRYLFDQFDTHRAQILDLDHAGRRVSTLELNGPISFLQVGDRDDRVGYAELVFAPQTDRIAAIMSSGLINVWSFGSGRLIRATPCGLGNRYLGACQSGERFCAYQTVNGIWTIRIINAKDGRVCTQVNGLNGMTDILFNQHGDRMIEEVSGRVWDTTKNRVINTCPSLPIDHSMVVTVNPDASLDHFFHPITRKLHRFDTGAAISAPLIDSPSANGQFSEDGRYLGISTDTSIKAVNLQTKHSSDLIPVGSSSIPMFAMKGQLLAGILRTYIGFWDPETGEQVLPNLPAVDAMSSTQFSDDGTAYACKLKSGFAVRRLMDSNNTDELLARATDALSLQKADSKTWNALLAKRTGLPFTQTNQDHLIETRLESPKSYEVQDAMGDSGLPEESATSYLNATKAEVGAGLWENAAESIRRAKAAGANEPGVLFLEGNIALQLGKYGKAEESFVHLLATERSKLSLLSAFQAAVGNRDYKTVAQVLDATSRDEATSFRFRKKLCSLITLAATGNSNSGRQFESYLEHCRTSEAAAFEGLGSLFARTAADLNVSQDRWSELRAIAQDQEVGDLDAQTAKFLLECRLNLPISGPEIPNAPETIFGIALRAKSDGKAKFLASLKVARTKLQKIIVQNNCRTLDDTLQVLRAQILGRECDRWIASTEHASPAH
jgi:WD40 repeat protein